MARLIFGLTLPAALPENPAGYADDAQYVTPAVLNAVALSQSHVSTTPTPASAPAAPTAGAPQMPVVGPDPIAPSAGVSQLSEEIPISTHAPGMAKYYAPVLCPPLPAQPSQSSTYTWPDSLVDVVLAPAPPAAPTPQQPAPTAVPDAPSEPLFFSPSPPAVLAPLPLDSTANRALSSMALGRTMAEDIMDIEASVPLPQLSTPILRNPLLVDATEEEILLFLHIKPLQGATLACIAGVLPEELLPQPEPSASAQASTAPPTQEPSYVMAPPSDTYEDPSLARSLAHLAGLFPSVSSETFTIVLNKVNRDLSAASAWMQSVSEVTKAKEVLSKAFPSAPVKEVESSLRHYKGDFLLSFYGLARTFEHTAEWNDLKRARSKGVMDIDVPAPDFVYDNPAMEAYEWQWWQIAVSI